LICPIQKINVVGTWSGWRGDPREETGIPEIGKSQEVSMGMLPQFEAEHLQNVILVTYF
jgi:hypothetical protein